MTPRTQALLLFVCLYLCVGFSTACEHHQHGSVSTKHRSQQQAVVPDPVTDCYVEQVSTYFATNPTMRLVLNTTMNSLRKKCAAGSNDYDSTLFMAIAEYSANNFVTHVPISHSHVGAAAIDDNGHAYCGGNSEYVRTELTATVHAEQSAVHHAFSERFHGLHANQIVQLTTTKPPCGYCRQFLNELQSAPTLKVVMRDPGHNTTILTLGLRDDLLQFNFGTKIASIGNGAGPFFSFQSPNSTLSPLATLALQEAAFSHSISSQMPAAVCVQFDRSSKSAPHHHHHHSQHSQVGTMADGVFCSRYTENVAHNPSMNPLSSALNLAALYGQTIEATGPPLGLVLVEAEYQGIGRQREVSHLPAVMSLMSVTWPNADPAIFTHVVLPAVSLGRELSEFEVLV